jgi:hypothetical protein
MSTHDLQVFTYNSYNNPVKQEVYDSNMVMPTHLYTTTYYYYELYDATSVANTGTQTVALTLFPNPVSNMLSLSCSSFTPGAPVSITITDMAGRKLLNETLHWQHTTEQVSVSDLLPGAYMVTVSDGKGNEYTQQIIKL